MQTLLSAVVAFTFGIFLRSLWHVDIFWIFFLLILLAFGFLFSFRYRTRKILPVLIFGAAFLVGVVRTMSAEVEPPQIFLSQVGQRVSFEGIVTRAPDVRDVQQRIPIRVSENQKGVGMLVITKRFPEVEVGEQISVRGTLARPQVFESESGRVFRYDKYLEKDGIRFLLNYASVTQVAPPSPHSPFVWFAKIKKNFLRGVYALLPEPYASLAGGIVIGGKQGLGKELLQAFTISGLIQIVVLSGYNVMVVAEAVFALLGYAPLSKRTASVCAGVAILFFVLIAGASSATIRAGLMALIALFARATGRTYAAGRALLLVLCVMLLWNPLLLVFDPGFDLSVLATAGLIWLSPLIELRLAFISNDFWRSGIATTIAAQIAVLPMLLYETGTLSLVAIPANVLTLPAVPAAMAFSALAGVMGVLFGTHILTTVMAFPAYVLNAYLIYVAKTAAKLPFSAFAIPAFPFWMVLLSYTLLIYIASSKRFSTTLQLRFSKKASM